MAAGGVALMAGASIAAGIGGACVAASWARGREAARRRRRAHGAGWDGNAEGAAEVRDRVLRYAIELTRRLALGAEGPLLGRARLARARGWFDVHARKAGVESDVSAQGFVEASARIALAAAAVAALVGAVMSTELAVAGAFAGAAWGATAVSRSIKRAARVRADGLGRDLPEMLEVVALGLRSGLSFDRSFDLYGAHFTSPFARACAAAQRSWSFGLATREDALRGLASSYESSLLTRVVESVVRSLRFGSSLAEVLEASAAEARTEHRARVEERVAKAPVKMMVPTGTLILPAMLLLVLGPVLLELMEGI